MIRHGLVGSAVTPEPLLLGSRNSDKFICGVYKVELQPTQHPPVLNQISFEKWMVGFF